MCAVQSVVVQQQQQQQQHFPDIYSELQNSGFLFDSETMHERVKTL